MADIFLSYASRDREAARRVAGVLSDRGWSVFWDREIPVRKTYDDHIEEELDAANCVVVLWSETAVASEWVRAEISEAAEQHILVPAFIGRARPPLRYRQMQAADLVDWTGDPDNREFLQLCDAIVAVAGPPAEEAKTPHAPTSADEEDEPASQATPEVLEPVPPTEQQTGEQRELVSLWRRWRLRWIAALLILAALGGVVIYQVNKWEAQRREIARQNADAERKTEADALAEASRKADADAKAKEEAEAKRKADARQVIALPPVQQEELPAEAWYNRAFNATDTDEKLRFYGKAILLKPDFAAAYYNRGNAREAKGDLDGALEDYDEAIRLDPELAKAYSNRGLARKAKGDLDGALEDYDEAIRLDPENASAYYNRGLARWTKNNLDGGSADYLSAIADFQRYLDLGGGIRDGDQAEVEEWIRDLRK